MVGPADQPTILREQVHDDGQIEPTLPKPAVLIPNLLQRQFTVPRRQGLGHGYHLHSDVAMNLSGHKDPERVRQVQHRQRRRSTRCRATTGGPSETGDARDEEPIVSSLRHTDSGWRVDRYNGSFASARTSIAGRLGTVGSLQLDNWREILRSLAISMR
jgi:hypothetical protein